jgi:hypothetical protein
MVAFDTTTLASMIQRCFDLALDGRVPAFERSRYGLEGKRLRGCLLKLVSARFDADTTAFVDATDELAKVDARLASDVEAIQKAGAVLTQLGSFVGLLDRLLAAAVAFV